MLAGFGHRPSHTGLKEWTLPRFLAWVDGQGAAADAPVGRVIAARDDGEQRDPRRVLQRAQELVPDVQAEIWPDATHAVSGQYADRVNARVVDFLDGLEGIDVRDGGWFLTPSSRVQSRAERRRRVARDRDQEFPAPPGAGPHVDPYADLTGPSHRHPLAAGEVEPPARCGHDPVVHQVGAERAVSVAGHRVLGDADQPARTSWPR